MNGEIAAAIGRQYADVCSPQIDKISEHSTAIALLTAAEARRARHDEATAGMIRRVVVGVITAVILAVGGFAWTAFNTRATLDAVHTLLQQDRSATAYVHD